jgi:hypothetical protein
MVLEKWLLKNVSIGNIHWCWVKSKSVEFWRNILENQGTSITT